MEDAGQEETVLSVLDLPQLYTKPPAADLLLALDWLHVKRIAWDDASQEINHAVDECGVPKYLTSIVGSSLAWIADDNIKEQIWEAASARLCERSGRSAIPSVTRTFVIPATSFNEAVPITLHEPSLTADNLGHKTWLASFLLAKRFSSLIPHLRPLPRKPGASGSLLAYNDGGSSMRAIELGAGTGLVGLAVAAISNIHVHLTDLPAIVPNLRANVESNAMENTSVGELDWSNLEDEGEQQKCDLVVAADPLYSPQHPAWLVAAIKHVLKQDGNAKVVIELPLRKAYMPEVEDLKKRMEGVGLGIELEGLESGFEDWESAHEKNVRTEVQCWWAVWRWNCND
ncbi:MAG: hypothetical protein Q9216_004793 [Gyalolechia sp. 2 TL-2023]